MALQFVCLFVSNLSRERPNEPTADPYLYLACLVLMTFPFFIPHISLAEGVQACHIPTEAACSDLLVVAGGGPWKEKMQRSPRPLTLFLGDAQYLFPC